MLSVEEALHAVLEHSIALKPLSISLPQSHLRVLADDLAVPQDSPPFDKALMDGFAVSAEEHVLPDSHSENSKTFQVLETVTAGLIPSQRVCADRAVRIMTGAQLPEGCNCVVPIEQTRFDESKPQFVTIPMASLKLEANLMRQGGVARAGSALLPAGTRLQSQQIAALAEFGFGTVPVFPKPKVAVLATGNELIGFDEPLQPGKIRNSNEPMLAAQVCDCFGTPVPLGVARDDVDELSSRIQRGLENDVLLLTGGVSAGTLDLVPQQLQNAGVQCVFHGVKMKPGKPLWFGFRDVASRRCLVFGLPGNPVSSLVCFELFVKPALEKMMGVAPVTSGFQATLMDDIVVRGNRPVYQPVRVTCVDGRLHAALVPWNGSSDLRATVEANAMALLEPEHGPYRHGEFVSIWLWGDRRLRG